VLHRQFSSPTSSVFVESLASQDLAQDNKDVLIERLNDLVVRLSKDGSLEDSAVSAIHTGVDQIELLMKSKEKGSHRKSPSVGSETRVQKGSGEDIFWGSLSPTRSVRMRFPDSPTSPHHSVHHVPPMNAQRAIELAKEAEELASRLSTTVAELQVRKEESDVSFTESPNL
jgi:hypothetical protein